MWKLKIAEGRGDPWLTSLSNFIGRQHWEFDPDAGTSDERAEVEKAREEFKRNRFNKRQSADLLMRMQLRRENPNLEMPKGVTLKEDEVITQEAVSTTLRRALNFFSTIQACDGHWPSDNAGPLFFLPPFVMALYVSGDINKILSTEHQKEIKLYIYNHQNEDGGWGFHIESHSTMFGSVLNYIALRLLGEGPDDGEDDAVARGRQWILDRGGANSIPSWGKFWLSVLGVYEWDGCNPTPPELWLLPNFLPMHPGKTLCYCRLVYMPVSYLYGRRFVGPITELIQSLRKELYIEPYHKINWNKARNTCAKEDLYYPHFMVQDMIWDFLHRIAEPILKCWPFSKIREKALKIAIENVHYEDVNSRYCCIGCVEKILCLMACWVEDPNSEAYKKHLARVPDYLWLSEDGMKFQSLGCQTWDASLGFQAIIAAGLSQEYATTLKKAHHFLKASQSEETSRQLILIYDQSMRRPQLRFPSHEPSPSQPSPSQSSPAQPSPSQPSPSGAQHMRQPQLQPSPQPQPQPQPRLRPRPQLRPPSQGHAQRQLQFEASTSQASPSQPWSQSQGRPTAPAPERPARPASDLGQGQTDAQGEAHVEAGGEGQDQGQLPALDPDGLWFDNTNVVRSITKAMKAYFHRPWKNYSEVDQATKVHWWNIWKNKYTWRPELDSDVRSSYEGKIAVRLKDLHNDVVHKRRDRPDWLSEDLYKQMKAGVQDERFQIRSARAKANRRSGNAAANPSPSHCQGSISTTQRAKRLASKKGKMPNAADLYLDTHFKKDPKGELHAISSRAKEVMDQYETHLSESQASGSEKDPNEVFFETVGGFRKGEVLGLGKGGASLYYDRRRPVGSSSAYSPSVTAQLARLTERLEASERAREALEERERLREEERRQEREDRRKQLEYIEQMKMSMDAFMRKFDGPPHFPPGPPDDPTDGSGASGAFLA